MELYMDEKWKLSKKESRNSSSSSSSSSSRRSECRGEKAYLNRSSSMPVEGSSRERVSSHRSFTSRCARLVKDQRAKFYIMRRCITMLICWRDYP